MKCTWQNCQQEASYPQTGSDGIQWANLCKEHHEKLDFDLFQLNPKLILATWITAQGGSKAAVDRMMGR